MPPRLAPPDQFDFPLPPVTRVFGERQVRWFFEYWTSLSRKLTDREKGKTRVYKPPIGEVDLAKVIVRVYQSWPRRKFKPKGESTTIATFDGACPFPVLEWERAWLERFGSGVYRVYLGEIGSGAGCVCFADINVFDLDFPPKVAVEDLDIAHKDNATYVKQLRDQGIKFPGDENEEEQQMNETQAKLIDTVLEVKDRLAAVQTESAVNAVKAENDGTQIENSAATRAMSMVVDLADKMVAGSEKRAEAATNANNPTQLLNMLGSLLEHTKPDMTLVTESLKSAGQLQLEIARMNQAAVERAEKRAESYETILLKTATQPAAAPPAAANATPQNDLVSQLETFGRLRDFFQPAAAARTVRAESLVPWDKIIAAAVPLVTAIVVRLTSPAAVPPVSAATNGQAQPASQPALPAAPVRSDPDEAAFVAAGVTGDLIPIMRKITEPLCQHFVGQDTNGYTFANWFVTNGIGADEVPEMRAQFDMIKQAGPEALYAVIKAWPPIWNRIGGFGPARIQGFIGEFLRYDDWLTQQQPAT
jgi:hypothetical protein